MKTNKATKEANNGQVQSLTRGLLLLEKISENPYGISLTELALQVGLPNSTVHRLLTTMQQQGMITQMGELGLWRIAVKTFTIGSAFFRSRELVTIAQPIMQKLMQAAGETVNLVIFDRISYKTVLIAQVECNELMRMVAPIGGDLPLHASGAGKLFLASLSEEELQKAILKNGGLPRLTDQSIATNQALTEELSLIKRQGFAIDDEEQAIGLRCVAAAIHDETGIVYGAISISGPASRLLNEQILHLSSLVTHAAKDISKSYGFKP